MVDLKTMSSAGQTRAALSAKDVFHAFEERLLGAGLARGLLDVIGGLRSDSLFARVPPTRKRALELLGGQLFRNRDGDGTVHGHVALYGEGTASDELMRAAKALADRDGVVLNTHVGFDLDLAAATGLLASRYKLDA